MVSCSDQGLRDAIALVLASERRRAGAVASLFDVRRNSQKHGQYRGYRSSTSLKVKVLDFVKSGWSWHCGHRLI